MIFYLEILEYLIWTFLKSISLNNELYLEHT